MKKIVLTLVLMFFATKAIAFEPPGIPAAIALQKLKDGNSRFVTYQMKHPNQGKPRREKIVNGQHPFAVILSCSDSRVPPEIIFDQGLGDLFVIRNAGNVIDEHVMGSIEYAVHHLGVNLVIVLGHESCGAVGAAMKEDKESPDIESIKASITPAIEKCKELKAYSYENVIRTHAKMDVDTIFENKELKEYSIKHDLKILPAYYSITTGQVEFLKQE
jgi:carbonic anhydrase